MIMLALSDFAGDKWRRRTSPILTEPAGCRGGTEGNLQLVATTANLSAMPVVVRAG